MPRINTQRELEKTTKRINENPKINQQNKQLLHTFKRDLTLDGLSKSSINQYLATLSILASHLEDKDLDQLTKDEVKDLVEWIHTQNLTPTTRTHYKIVLKRFYKWLNDGEHPPETKWIKTTHNQKNKTLPQDLLTPEDVDKLIDGARNPRDKALIALLWETGGRIGEIMDLTVGDIEDYQHGAKITLQGKTGSRRIAIIESLPHLNQWLAQHPDPAKTNPLWCKLKHGGPEDRLGYNYIRLEVLKKAAERAGVDKPVNPHHFRHSRASYLANHLTESQLCQYFGWVQGSNVPAKYVHLSGRDTDRAIEALHGITRPEDEEREERIQECPRCQEINTHTTRFCGRCGMPLDKDTAEDLDEASAKLTREAKPAHIQALATLLRDTDPETVKRVAEMLAQEEQEGEPQ